VLAWRPRRAARVAAGLLLAAILAACSGPPPAPAPAPQRPPQDTITRATEGTRLTVTASVERVLGPHAFVVRDADLPDDGLLVLVTTRAEVRRQQLVTVEGVVIRFRYADHTDLGPADPSEFERYEGRKVLIGRLVPLPSR